MHAAVLFLLPDAGDATLESALGDSWPAADVESTAYLDGAQIYHGTIAGDRAVSEPNATVDGGAIEVEQDERMVNAVGEFYADPQAGWAGVDTSKAAGALRSYLAGQFGSIPLEAAIDLDSWVEEYGRNDSADVDQITYGGEDGATARFNADARMSDVPTSGIKMFGFDYSWNGEDLTGVLAASGYVALHTSVEVEVFARWLAEEVRPHLEESTDDEDDGQSTFGGGL